MQKNSKPENSTDSVRASARFYNYDRKQVALIDIYNLMKASLRSDVNIPHESEVQDWLLLFKLSTGLDFLGKRHWTERGCSTLKRADTERVKS